MKHWRGWLTVPSRRAETADMAAAALLPVPGLFTNLVRAGSAN